MLDTKDLYELKDHTMIGKLNVKLKNIPLIGVLIAKQIINALGMLRMGIGLY